ncbi:MAG: 16S rRNA (uracil(1498)-N(3))-methyltransferase [Saprospiraceae bacterium]|nr:16S rRNA (uracil(1498)-N(3))-methyltransferase [Candidatus Opimibacter iunctus]
MGVNSLPWYYAPALGEAGTTVSLAGDEWHHCHNVLRLGAGDAILLFNGAGLCMEGIIRGATRNEGNIELTCDHTDTFAIDRSYTLSIALAPTKNIDRTEFAVEKLVELGVDEICFLDCDHSERAHLRMDRMEKIALSAAKQSRKLFLPVIRPLMSPGKIVENKKQGQPDTLIYCCHLDNSSVPLAKNYLPGRNVLMMIGPEGGFSIEETKQMAISGASMVTLGPFRLRVETAAIAACAAIHILNEQKSSS